MKVRRAELNDLDELVEFTAAEAREAEGCTKDTKTLVNGIKAALKDRSIAMYWVQDHDSKKHCIKVTLMDYFFVAPKVSQ